MPLVPTGKEFCIPLRRSNLSVVRVRSWKNGTTVIFSPWCYSSFSSQNRGSLRRRRLHLDFLRWVRVHVHVYSSQNPTAPIRCTSRKMPWRSLASGPRHPPPPSCRRTLVTSERLASRSAVAWSAAATWRRRRGAAGKTLPSRGRSKQTTPATARVAAAAAAPLLSVAETSSVQTAQRARPFLPAVTTGRARGWGGPPAAAAVMEASETSPANGKRREGRRLPLEGTDRRGWRTRRNG